GDTLDGQIAARCVQFQAGHLRRGDRAQQGNATFFVVIDANPQVDLVRPRVGVEGFIEAENRIARRHFDSREQTHGGEARREEGEWYSTLASCRGLQANGQDYSHFGLSLRRGGRLFGGR